MESLHVYENLDGEFLLVREYKEDQFKKEEIVLRDKDKKLIIDEFKRIIKDQHRITHHSYVNCEVISYDNGTQIKYPPCKFCEFN